MPFKGVKSKTRNEKEKTEENKRNSVPLGQKYSEVFGRTLGYGQSPFVIYCILIRQIILKHQILPYLVLKLLSQC